MAKVKVLREKQTDGTFIKVYPITSENAVLDENGKSMATKVNNLSQEIAGKYTKPDGGIPADDLASDVQTSISRADEIYNDYIATQNLM